MRNNFCITFILILFPWRTTFLSGVLNCEKTKVQEILQIPDRRVKSKFHIQAQTVVGKTEQWVSSPVTTHWTVVSEVMIPAGGTGIKDRNGNTGTRHWQECPSSFGNDKDLTWVPPPMYLFSCKLIQNEQSTYWLVWTSHRATEWLEVIFPAKTLQYTPFYCRQKPLYLLGVYTHPL